MGEEWGASTPFQYFTDHHAELGKAVSEGRKREFSSFGWKPEDVPDPQDVATFERSKLKWAEIAQSPHREMLEWYRALIALRHRMPLARGPVGEGVHVDVDEGATRIAIARDGVAVFVNLGEADWNAKLEGPMKVALCSPPDTVVEKGKVCLPPSSVAVLEEESRG
jgi:maltooligosyltrehalose trehalohydrolase